MMLGDVWDSQNVRQLRSEIVGEQPREGRVHPVQYLDKMWFNFRLLQVWCQLKSSSLASGYPLVNIQKAIENGH